MIRYYCINLPERKDRRQHAENQFKSAGIEVEFIYAVKSSPRQGLSKERASCVDSHAVAINKIANLPKGEIGCIFEDDVVLCKDFKERLDKFLSIVPAGWDALCLGYDMPDNESHVRITDKLFILNHCIGAHAYILNQQSAKVLLDWRKKINLHNDNYISKILCAFYRVYGYYPCLAKQRVDYSALHSAGKVIHENKIWISQCKCFADYDE
jgi:GR25 family glycosyltransferase involved in LPS biosynthesis